MTDGRWASLRRSAEPHAAENGVAENPGSGPVCRNHRPVASHAGPDESRRRSGRRPPGCGSCLRTAARRPSPESGPGVAGSWTWAAREPAPGTPPAPASSTRARKSAGRSSRGPGTPRSSSRRSCPGARRGSPSRFPACSRPRRRPRNKRGARRAVAEPGLSREAPGSTRASPRSQIAETGGAGRARRGRKASSRPTAPLRTRRR